MFGPQISHELGSLHCKAASQDLPSPLQTCHESLSRQEGGGLHAPRVTTMAIIYTYTQEETRATKSE